MVVWAPRALRHYVYSCSSIVFRASGAVRQSDMTTPSETSFRDTSKTYYKLDHSAIIGMHFSHRSWPDHFKAFPNVRLAQTRMWQPNIMVWGLTRATEGRVCKWPGLAWPGWPTSSDTNFYNAPKLIMNFIILPSSDCTFFSDTNRIISTLHI